MHAPALLLSGDKSQNSSDQQDAFAEALPNGRLRLFAGNGQGESSTAGAMRRGHAGVLGILGPRSRERVNRRLIRCIGPFSGLKIV